MKNLVRSSLWVLLLSIAVAGALASASWQFLPYEALHREDPAERFLLWEAMMWMAGLAAAGFGAAAWFGSTDLYGVGGDPYTTRAADHIRIQVQDGVRGRMLFTDLPAVPWMMMGTGLALILIAVIVRVWGPT